MEHAVMQKCSLVFSALAPVAMRFIFNERYPLGILSFASSLYRSTNIRNTALIGEDLCSHEKYLLNMHRLAAF